MSEPASESPLQESQNKKGDLSYHYWAGQGGGDAPPPMPKKLTNEEAATLERSNSSSTTATGASAWNSAGTWEEKNYFDWAKESIKTQLVGAGPTIENGSASITGIEKCTGEANVVCVRGKVRHGYDLDLTLEWEVIVDDKKTQGTMRIPEVSLETVSENELQCEVKVTKPKKTDAAEEKKACAVMKGALPMIHEALLKFDTEFKLKGAVAT